MKIADYIDSTYLKTPKQSGLSASETLEKVLELTQEAIDNQIIAVMIRPNYVKKVAEYIQNKNANVLVGTVIDFPLGNSTIGEKLAEAQKAINHGADELDFVINYQEFIKGNIDLVKDEFLSCTTFVLEKGKTIKWIIEVAALSNEQIIAISELFKTISLEHFKESQYPKIFIKSSTGFYPTENNGATKESIDLMLKHGKPLPIKAAGGVRTLKDAIDFIKMGVQRIGTSSGLELIGN